MLYRALVETGCVAVGESVMHGRECAVVFQPSSRGRMLHTLVFANKVRLEEESPSGPGLG